MNRSINLAVCFLRSCGDPAQSLRAARTVCLSFLLVGAGLFWGGQLVAQEPMDLARLGAQVAQELGAHASIPFLSYTSEIEIIGEDEFFAGLKVSKEYQHGVRTVEFCADQERYLWKTHTDYDSGRRGQIMHGAWSGSLLQVLTFDGTPTLIHSKDRWGFLGSTFVDSNSFFLPFAFLTPHTDLENKVACSLKELATPDAFDAAWKKAVGLKATNLGDTPCYSVAIPLEDHLDVVYFQAAKPFYPIGCDRLRPDGTIHRRYRVENLKQVPESGLWYPAKASHEWFLMLGKKNMKTFTNIHRITAVGVTPPASPVNYILDAKSAVHILDRDKNPLKKLE